MALTTFHSTTDVQEIIPTEFIRTAVEHAKLPPPTGISVVAVIGSRGSIPVRFPRFNALAVPAGTKTEGDDFTLIETDTEEESITPGLVGFGYRVSDEVVAGAVVGVPANLLEASLMATLNRIDSDIHAGSTAATLITGTDTDIMTAANVRSAMHAAIANDLIPDGVQTALVLSEDAWQDFDNDLSNRNASLIQDDAMGLLLGPRAGFKGRFRDMNVFVSKNVATTGSGRSNYITIMGDRSGLGLVLNERPNARPTRGDSMELAAGFQVVYRAWYGAGMRNRESILEVLGRT